ncbi:growth-regulating factor 4-like [Dioscorea cayenensis subsp. rotundata]|uniref:Growth-regulating factor n=1 Tax=Dioscorea cayennensis subsp. rotundata TaxID=55577 RepID=A0AB40C6W9_DIOCR|nr:growth-regulating factor 4-like [Dioscorea cayenensis subsp. rotundata]
MHSTAVAGWRSAAFTASQWVELEHQALIYKYLMAGVPVPPDLLLPIRRSFFHFSALGYPSCYGMKLDPEPGRCRRTDGKKWRCSKDAHPDSKYCERHMHRSRNRSRKPVETQAISKSQSSSSTVTSLSPTVSAGNGRGSGSFQSFPLHSVSGRNNPQTSRMESNAPLLHMDSASFGFDDKEFRYVHGGKSDANVDGHNVLTGESASDKGLLGGELDRWWSSFPSSKSSYHPELQLQAANNLGQTDIMSSLTMQQHSLLGSEYAGYGSISSEQEKHESGQQVLRPLFDEWPKTRDHHPWSLGFSGDDHSNRTTSSFSATQLSMSIPMPSADFSTTACSSSPNA